MRTSSDALDPASSETTTLFGMFSRRMRVVPTARGWFVLLVITALLGTTIFRGLYPFLAVNDPQEGGALVIGGWASVETMREVIKQADQGKFTSVFVIGGRPESGGLLYSYSSAAEAGASLLTRLSGGKIKVVPIPTKEWADNTQISARKVRDWIAAHGDAPSNLTVITDGPTARRTRLLYRRVFPKSYGVGVIAIEPSAYDPHAWWRYSAGVRSMVNELAGYFYDVVATWP